MKVWFDNKFYWVEYTDGQTRAFISEKAKLKPLTEAEKVKQSGRY